MTIQLQLSDTPAGTDFAFLNLTGTDIPAGCAVGVDTAHVISAANQTQQGIAVALPSADGGTVIGVAMETLKNGQPGRVRCFGPIAIMTADGAITGNGYVMATNDV